MATALLVPVGIGVSASTAGAAGPSAACSGSSGSATITPGLLFLKKNRQGLAVAGVNETCTGGTVTSAAIASVRSNGVAVPLETSTEVNCQQLLANIGSATPITWTGRVKATWNAGMGSTIMSIKAHITSSVGHSTHFKFTGNTVNGITAGSPFVSNAHVSGGFTINKGLHAVASGGDCSSQTLLSSAGITQSALNVTS